jgi:hypothetical protein
MAASTARSLVRSAFVCRSPIRSSYEVVPGAP